MTSALHVCIIFSPANAVDPFTFVAAMLLYFSDCRNVDNLMLSFRCYIVFHDDIRAAFFSELSRYLMNNFILPYVNDRQIFVERLDQGSP